MEQLLRYGLSLLWGAVPALLAYLFLLSGRQKRLAGAKLRSAPLREIAVAAFWMFCGGMAMLTLTPRWVSVSLLDVLHGYRWNGAGYPFFELGAVNLIPFRSLGNLFIDIGNIIMFVPFGFFSALLWRGYAWKRALLTGLAITGFIECWQIFIGRAFDIDDLMLNTLGVLVGYWVWLLLRRIAPGFVARFQCGPARPTPGSLSPRGESNQRHA